MRHSGRPVVELDGRRRGLACSALAGCLGHIGASSVGASTRWRERRRAAASAVGGVDPVAGGPDVPRTRSGPPGVVWPAVACAAEPGGQGGWAGMDFGLVGKAAGLFAVTNIDDLVVLAVFFGQTASRAG